MNYGREGSELFPAINLIENKKDFEFEMAVPGFTKEDIHVDMEGSQLIINAERKEEKDKEEKNYRRKEFSYNSFKRTFTIPENVDEKSIEANFKDGVLHIRLKKLLLEEKENVRHISVK
jgi:HSP20 family protein